MFGSAVLEVAIGLVLVYLLLSLICSAINEGIETFLHRRAADLARGIRELLTPAGATPTERWGLSGPAGPGVAANTAAHLDPARDLVERLYSHPLVSSLFPGKYDRANTNNLPAYIPSRNFALALLDLVMPARAGAPSQPDLGALRDTVAKVGNPQVRDALLPLIDAAGNDLDRLRQNVQDWYDGTMDRVSGWYKRKTQIILFWIGLGAAVAANADSVAIGRALARDRTVREAVVQVAGKAGGAANFQQATDDLNKVHELGLPLGWDPDDDRAVPQKPYHWVIKALGWLATALAVTLGAPFWFDLLNKFMVVRSTVKPREKSPDEPPVDGPAPAPAGPRAAGS